MVETVSANPSYLDFSVAICTYNGERRLPDVLAALQQQIDLDGLTWELIVVDNNSNDATAQVVESFQANWPAHVSLRYAFEQRQGAGFARHHAARIARSQLIGFLDDDNVPAPDWIRAAYQFGQEHPEAGVYGSRIRGDFETAPPPHFERIQAFLALTERGSQPLLYEPSQKILPPSAGMVVRRQVWLDNVPEEQVLSGPTSSNILAGEDLEAILHIQKAGWQVWYNPAMRVQHKIPSGRLQLDYLKKLFRGIGLSRYRTRMLSFPGWQRPLVLPLYTLNDSRKLLLHLLRYRMAVFSDPVVACEMTLYTYSLLSPMYFWQRHWRQRLSFPR